ncbi:MAG: SH3 domain-containing protein [Flavobacteriales bacterium]|jgi:hypothetical protein|nr:SH3 domain-containing protein [Flavobacteriales bacterium]
MNKISLLFLASVFVFSCSTENKKNQTNQLESDIDVCKCLLEPGNSKFMIDNEVACRDAISREIGVENWEKINMSKNPNISVKWDELVERCTGSKESGIEAIDQNNKLTPEIGTSNGYIWESINTEAQIYVTLAFDDLIFRIASYSMNGQNNSEDFSKLFDLSGSWNTIDNKNIEGIISASNIAVSWVFSDDYSYLTNNKGVTFDRVDLNKPLVEEVIMSETIIVTEMDDLIGTDDEYEEVVVVKQILMYDGNYSLLCKNIAGEEFKLYIKSFYTPDDFTTISIDTEGIEGKTIKANYIKRNWLEDYQTGEKSECNILVKVSFVKDAYNEYEKQLLDAKEFHMQEENHEFFRLAIINDADGYTNVRNEPNSKSKILFEINDDQEFKVINPSKNDSWWIICYKGNYGFMHKSKVEIIDGIF